jgi:bifunctional non-homologous end joining protein LigD
MRLRLVKDPFDNSDYIFELKQDGFRALVFIENGECRLVSRNLKNLRFESLKSALCLSKISKCLSGWGLFLLYNSR